MGTWWLSQKGDAIYIVLQPSAFKFYKNSEQDVFCFKWNTNVLPGCHISNPRFCCFHAGKKSLICFLFKMPKALCFAVIKLGRTIMDSTLFMGMRGLWFIISFISGAFLYKIHLHLRWGVYVHITFIIIE